MIAIIGVISAFVTAGGVVTRVLPSVMPLTLAVLIVLTVGLLIGGAAIHEFRRVNRKVAALTHRRSGPSRETPSTDGTEIDPEAPLS